MTRDELLDLLCCPGCHFDLDRADDRAELSCRACGFTFPIIDGIPILFPCNVAEQMDELFGRYWDSDDHAAYYDSAIEGEQTGDIFGRYQHESEMNGMTACYDPAKLGVVLDAGCGNGRFLASLPEASIKIGADASLNLLRATQRRGRGDLLVCCELEHLPFKNGIFDSVITCRVLQHVIDQRRAVSEFARILRAEGDVILEVYNTWNPKTLYKEIRMRPWLGRILNAPFHLVRASWSPFGPWGLDYDRYNSWFELAGWLRASGMRVSDGRGVGFGYPKYLLQPLGLEKLLAKFLPRLLKWHYDLCLRIEPLVGRFIPFKYVMEKIVIRATKAGPNSNPS